MICKHCQKESDKQPHRKGDALPMFCGPECPDDWLATLPRDRATAVAARWDDIKKRGSSFFYFSGVTRESAKAN